MQRLPILNVAGLINWKAARKAKPIKAKPMATMLTDQTVIAKFMLDTLEGTQGVRPDSMVCVGPDADVWQQDRAKLLKTYSVTEITPDGWLVCTPKPEAVREVVKVTAGMLAMDEMSFLLPNTNWGTKQPDGSFVQAGVIGDYVVRNPDDPADVWVVAKKVFDNTYEFISSAVTGAESSEGSIQFRSA